MVKMAAHHILCEYVSTVARGNYPRTERITHEVFYKEQGTNDHNMFIFHVPTESYRQSAGLYFLVEASPLFMLVGC